MLCPSCCLKVSNDTVKCPKCGFDFENIQNNNDSIPVSEPQAFASSGYNFARALIFISLAVIVLMLAFISASKFSGTETVIFDGLALVVCMHGIFFSAVLVWLGLKKWE